MENANPDYVFMLFLVNARKLINNDDIPIMSKRKMHDLLYRIFIYNISFFFNLVFFPIN